MKPRVNQKSISLTWHWSFLGDLDLLQKFTTFVIMSMSNCLSSLLLSSLISPSQKCHHHHYFGNVSITLCIFVREAGKGKSRVPLSLLMSHLYWIYLRPINQPTPVTTSYFRTLAPPQTNGNHHFLFAQTANDTGAVISLFLRSFSDFSMSANYFSICAKYFSIFARYFSISAKYFSFSAKYFSISAKYFFCDDFLILRQVDNCRDVA